MAAATAKPSYYCLSQIAHAAPPHGRVSYKISLRLHLSLIGATGFEPVTSCTPSKRASPSCATPRFPTRINRDKRCRLSWAGLTIVESSEDVSIQPQVEQRLVHFVDRLFTAIRRVGNPVVVGIDPRPDEL